MYKTNQVLIFGPTGNVGNATAQELLQRGWHVRAATRNPQSEKAKSLAELGVELVKADMDDRNSIDAAFDGIRRVFSVQNWVTSSVDGEVRQGNLVADAAKSAGVTHLVFGSAGIGEADTPVPWTAVRDIGTAIANIFTDVMWRWMVDWMAEGAGRDVEMMIDLSRQVCPNLHSIESWLKISSNGHNGNGAV